MTAQKKTIIKRAFLCVMGDSGGEGVDILVVIKDRDSHRVQMRGLPGEGFLHLKAAEVELGFFDQTRQHRGVDGMNVQDGVGFREQAINQRVKTGFCRRSAARGRAVGGNFNLQKVRRCQAAFVFAGFAEPAEAPIQRQASTRCVSCRLSVISFYPRGQEYLYGLDV